jgi:hypothetical protein
MLQRYKERAVTVAQAAKLTEEELQDKIVIGKFMERVDRMEYSERYKQLRESLKGAK